MCLITLGYEGFMGERARGGRGSTASTSTNNLTYLAIFRLALFCKRYFDLQTIHCQRCSLSSYLESSIDWNNIVTFPYRKVYILDNKLEFSGIELAES